MTGDRRVGRAVQDAVWDRPDMRQALDARDVGAVYRLVRRMTGLSQSQLGELLGGVSQPDVSAVERGRRRVTEMASIERAAAGLGMPDRARTRLGLARADAAPVTGPRTPDAAAELEAVELSRRVSASDVGGETLERLERAVDDLATRYSATPPPAMLSGVRAHLGYVSRLLDARKSLAEHRRLLVVGGWLSLLAGTVYIDLQQRGAGWAHLATAADLAEEAGHAEIHAWCWETRAWSRLTDGRYREALDLSLTAQRLAPHGSSVAVQATAQEGRSRARLRERVETYAALDRVSALVSPRPRPDRPEHHYHYDPDKHVAYTATTLAWLGDPTAERYAREVITRLRGAESAGGWPRRVAAAQLDLGLALLVTGQLDEASASVEAALSSGRVVPSNRWRALEVVRAVEDRGYSQAPHLREAFIANTTRASHPA